MEVINNNNNLTSFHFNKSSTFGKEEMLSIAIIDLYFGLKQKIKDLTRANIGEREDENSKDDSDSNITEDEKQ